MSDVIVYQVRVIDANNNVRIVHAYETEDAAKAAIATMRRRAPARYTYSPVTNQPDAYWGINFPPPMPEKPLKAGKRPVYGITELPSKTAPKAS
jgi:hypothetical protein